MLTSLAVLALVVGLLGLLAGFLALRTLGRLRRSVGLLGRGPSGRETYAETTARAVAQADRTRAEFDTLRSEVHGALERYDNEARLGLSHADALVAGQLESVRADTRAQFEANLEQMMTHLGEIRRLVDTELVAIRTGLDEQRTSVVEDIAGERTRAAAADAASKEQVRALVGSVDQVIAGALRRVALVRYDAFDELSGRLSFSLALLDGHGDGITLTSVAGFSDTRIYAKPINAGQAVVDLSPEEEQAVAAALRS